MKSTNRDSKSRDYSRGPRSNNARTGQSRGGQNVSRGGHQSRDRSRDKNHRGQSGVGQSQQYNTIAHNNMNRQAIPKQPVVGNFMHGGGPSPLGPNHLMNNSLGFHNQSLALNQQTSASSQQHKTISGTQQQSQRHSQGQVNLMTANQPNNGLRVNHPQNQDALKGLTQKQTLIYNDLFTNFSGDGKRISAIEFFKLCKLCKIYPVVITFEDLKKIVLKNKEFWSNHDVMAERSKSRGRSNDFSMPEPSPDNSFPFNEFVNAFRIIGRIGYAKTGETDTKMFQLVTQYLQKQLKALRSKNQMPLEQNNVQQTQMQQIPQTSSQQIISQQQQFIDSSRPIPQPSHMNLNQSTNYEMGGLIDGKRGSDDMVVTLDSRQPKFHNNFKKKQMYEDDKQSVRTTQNVGHQETMLNSLVRNADVRSEYSGTRGGIRKAPNQLTTIQAGGGHAQSTLIAGGQPVIRANTIHRTLVPNGQQQQLSKPKSKKRSAARKNPIGGNMAASVSLKREIDIRSNQNMQNMQHLYASSNQPQRSHANNRGVSSSQVSQNNMSNISGSVNSKQFQQVRLRKDISLNSNKSPNRYTNTRQPHVQQTIQYNLNRQFMEDLPPQPGPTVKQISQSLVAQHRNRNLIGGQHNNIRPQMDSMSVGLNSKFSSNTRGQSQVVEKLQASPDQNRHTLTAVKAIKKDFQTEKRDRDGSNSQRSFRIRKNTLRSNSRTSNISKMSNRSHDHVNRDNQVQNAAPNIDTIEHPTDIEDANLDDNQSEFEPHHMLESPDIRLKSIEIDNEINTQQRKKKQEQLRYHNDSFADDHSGTGNKPKSMVQANTYGSKMSTQAEVAVALLRKMKNCFEKFQDKVQKQETTIQRDLKRDSSNVSVRSNTSFRSNASQQRFVKLKKLQTNDEKDQLIAQLRRENQIKEQRIKELEALLTNSHGTIQY